MKLYTAQMSKGKTIPKTHDIPVLDVTVKSGDVTFAPTWDFLMEYKKSAKTPADEEWYKLRFREQMHRTFKADKARWLEVLSMESLCILCYCPADSFCHRHLLVDMFRLQCKQWGIPFRYMEEIK